jgi:hypothetical protein
MFRANGTEVAGVFTTVKNGKRKLDREFIFAHLNIVSVETEPNNINKPVKFA